MGLLTKLDTIVLYKGSTTVCNLDLTGFEFNGGTVLFTMKNKAGETIKTFEFAEPSTYEMVFTPELTAGLNLPDGCNGCEYNGDEYEYDIMHLLNGERHPQCLPSRVVVRKVVGGYEGN